MSRRFVIFTFIASLLALIIVILGAYVRISDAGLSCPDWPGCYNQLTVPSSTQQIDQANDLYPDRPVDTGKAWKEMIHRYCAGVLATLILGCAIAAWYNRRDPKQMVASPLLLLGVAGCQAALGMWTVTLLVQPAIVTLHLLGGMTLLSLVWWITLRQGESTQIIARVPGEYSYSFKMWALAGLLLLILQLALGGWTSTNYAGFSCNDFPTCQGQWWPTMNFDEAFTFWKPLGENYEGGKITPESATAIHVVHRIVAIVTLILLTTLGIKAMKNSENSMLHKAGLALVVLAFTQVGLGVSTAISGVSSVLAVAHNGIAALLLLSVITFNHLLHPVKYPFRGAKEL
ncbi:COX15/CtaA family protein [Candidatus Nitrosacidococcus sp. I8]|uniref:COX15/CtaA family protein n=1 Tax=Candidatus Nitrosacidococcus sp. I8 TaxID=2942908 RepID=UPI002226E371|nr:COX15/CtaA family protein [Candidatus Nitrosacidococcus sp. I8]CAH9019843.1 Heme A synthase [Candidatus Nitrosacidococcus sp. I8]